MCVLGLLPFVSACREEKTAGPGDYAVRMAKSVMARHPDSYYGWSYVTGVMMKAFESIWRQTGDDLYYQYIVGTVDSVIAEDGTIAYYDMEEFNIDQINEGRALLFLYQQTKEEKYRKAAQILRKQLSAHPRTSEGGFWHKKRYPHQMWLDGLYMGSPFYAEYGVLFEEPEAIDDVVKQFVLMEKYARDSETGLLYHGWDEKKIQEWADPETGLSQCFWGRATGWYAMALVDALDYVPADHPGHRDLIGILQRLAEAVLSVQDEATGVWWQVLDKPGATDNYLEASASIMFVYALAKGVRKGYLDEAVLNAVEKAYRGVLDTFITTNADGTLNLNSICRTAGLGYGRDGSYDYYVHQEEVVSNDGKGVGPFIMASLEMNMLEGALE
ncbi:MAG: glycoside hydrolase family 88 protein [Acidobacteria bacterium]|nr:glycoside hydrolase family 88 protein [Acidobacteriota bacterium]